MSEIINKTNSEKTNNLSSILINLSGIIFAPILFLTNGVIGISSLIALIVVLSANKDKFLLNTAKELFNFQITIALVLIISDVFYKIIYALMMMKYTFPENLDYKLASFVYGTVGKIAYTNIFSVLSFLFVIICTFFAIVNSYNKKDFKYPLTLNLLKLKENEEGDFRVTF